MIHSITPGLVMFTWPVMIASATGNGQNNSEEQPTTAAADWLAGGPERSL